MLVHRLGRSFLLQLALDLGFRLLAGLCSGWGWSGGTGFAL